MQQNMAALLLLLTGRIVHVLITTLSSPHGTIDTVIEPER